MDGKRKIWVHFCMCRWKIRDSLELITFSVYAFKYFDSNHHTQKKPLFAIYWLLNKTKQNKNQQIPIIFTSSFASWSDSLSHNSIHSLCFGFGNLSYIRFVTFFSYVPSSTRPMKKVYILLWCVLLKWRRVGNRTAKWERAKRIHCGVYMYGKRCGIRDGVFVVIHTQIICDGKFIY